MVVPGRISGGANDTQKAVESLFETQSIVEIREVSDNLISNGILKYFIN